MSANGLSVSRLVNVSVTLTPVLAQFPNFNTCLVLGTTSDVIDVVERIREYNTIDEVAADFGGTTEEYLSAVLWFEQNPQPITLYIGRWAKTATHGYLKCGTLTGNNALLPTWTAISNGSFKVTIDGAGSPESLTGLDFHLQTNFNGIASVISGGLSGCVCTYNAVYNRFEFQSTTTGTTSKVSFLTAGAAGTDISSMLSGLSTSSGAYVADGIAPETALAAVQIMDNRFSDQWYGLTIPSGADNDHILVGNYIEAANPPHFYGVSTTEAGVLVSGDTSNIAYQLQQLKLNHTAVQYSSTNPYSIMSAFARILTTNWLGNNTTITLMYKQEPGIVAETITASQMDALLAKNCNVFVNYNNNTAILQPGCSSSGQFVDSIIGCDWLRETIQTNVYNLLYGSTTKIPQTDAGMHILATGIEAALVQGVNNQLIAPGQWNANGFGQLQQGDYLPKGYYIYAPPVSSQAESDRQARKSVPFQVAAKLAGAVHTVDVSVAVNP